MTYSVGLKGYFFYYSGLAAQLGRLLTVAPTHKMVLKDHISCGSPVASQAYQMPQASLYIYLIATFIYIFIRSLSFWSVIHIVVLCFHLLSCFFLALFSMSCLVELFVSFFASPFYSTLFFLLFCYVFMSFFLSPHFVYFCVSFSVSTLHFDTFRCLCLVTCNVRLFPLNRFLFHYLLAVKAQRFAGHDSVFALELLFHMSNILKIKQYIMTDGHSHWRC